MKILDNVLPNSLVNELEDTMTGDSFPYFYMPGFTDPSEDGKEYKNFKSFQGLVHGFTDLNGNPNSGFYTMVMPIVYFLEKELDKQFKVLECRGHMLFKDIENKNKVGYPHIDNHGKHHVLMYYVNDSDGNTIIYNDKRDDAVTTKDVMNKNSILKTVEPKKGRMFLFDGDHWHSGTCPTQNNKRIFINFNLVEI